MDDLSARGGLGGALSLGAGYARLPLRVGEGGTRVAVVGNQAFADIGAALSYERFRLYANFGSPLVVHGASGIASGYGFAGPSLAPGRDPDTIADPRVGFDARLLGDAADPLRFGLGAQLYFPAGSRDDYVTDDTYRAMFRALLAGDLGGWSYAGHLGLHVRPLDVAPAPAGPRGSELLFGVAVGPRVALGPAGGASIVFGPEIFGESALRSLFGAETTAIEALLTGRLEGPPERAQLRLKLGAGGGVDARFGAPAWRLAFAIEVVDHFSTDQGSRTR